MRKLVVALLLGGALSLPAVATDWDAELDELAGRWAATGAPQSPWHDRQPQGEGAGYAVPIRAFAYAGSGWSTLDGWMKHDLLLRQWVARRFDSDADGALSVEEAATARRAFYLLADANRSGIITSEEFLNGWGTVRAAIINPYALAG